MPPDLSPQLLHLAFNAAAYAAGFALYRVVRRRQDFLAPDVRLSQVVAVILGAVVGAKVLHWLANPSSWPLWAERPLLLLGGKTLVGGLLGGWAAVEWLKARQGITERTGDVYVGPLLLGIVIGRLGCFSAGLVDGTAGIATALPWGIDFGDGVARHPTQLYEIAFVALLALLLYHRPPPIRGLRFRAFILAYLAFRLAVDFLKPYDTVLGMNPIQWSCLLVLLAQWREIPPIVRWLFAPAPASPPTGKEIRPGARDSTAGSS